MRPFIGFIAMLLFSCTAQQPIKVGNDKDAYGCIPSAGYQWSELKQDCIRSFELPLQLYNNDHTFSAGVLFSSNLEKAEVFCKEGRLLMINSNINKYSTVDDKYHLVNTDSVISWKVVDSLGSILYK
jgi:hypothetical protein